MSDSDNPRLPEPLEQLADLLDAREVADTLAVSVTTVRRWTATGALPHIKLGRRVLFHPLHVLELIRKNYRAGPDS